MKKFLLTFFIVSICLLTFAQWSSDPTENNRITPLSTEIYDHELKVSNDGTSFVVFNRPTGGNTATFLQIIDVNGNMLFSDQGMLISNEHTLGWTMVDQLLFIDDDGNAIVVVVDCRHSTNEMISYTLYKVSPTGEMLWDENGLDLCGGMAYGTIGCMNIIQLEDGSYVCAWMVESSNLYIQMQRISKAGELLWNEADARLYDPSTPHDYPYLVNAGENQFIVVFSKGTIFNRNLRARKFDTNCSAVWANDVSIFTGSFGYTPPWVIIRVIPDQMGGAFVGWFDDRYNTLTESTYMAHVTTNGTLGFDGVEGGVKIGYSSLRSFFPEIYFDKTEGFLYVAFRETDSNQDWQQMKAQKMEVTTGELMWNPNGIEVSPLIYDHSISFYTIQDGGDGNVAIFFTSNTYDPQYYYGWDINNVTLINSDGEYVWNDEIIQFSTPVGFKGSLLSTPLLFNNFWLTAWNDERKIAGDPDGSKKIYMQRINKDGTLGESGDICLPPANIIIEDITQISAVVSWEGNADHYELSYRMVNEDWITEEEIDLHSFTLEELIPNTDYQVRIRSICSEDNFSVWSAIKSFTTLDTLLPAPCETPVSLFVEEITQNSAKLSWIEGNEENLSWEIRFKESTAPSWIDVENLEEKFYFLEDLTENTAYLWTVRANCSDNQTSEWADENNFTTQPNSINNTNIETITVFSSGKMIHILNQGNIYIERVQLFNVNGKLLFDYVVKSTDNILIPTTFSSEMIVLVKITGKNEEVNFKVLVK